jgi:hypothetical protein
MRGNPAMIPSSFMIALYRSFLVLGSFLWLPQARAQAISLSHDQRAKLAQLVRDDPDAARLFNRLKRDADAATNDPGQPIVTIKTAGTLAADPAKIQSRASLKDMNKLNALGYASLLAPNSGYGAAAKRIILSWAEINQPTGIPVDETKLTPLLVAYDLTRSGFSEAECTVVDNWLRKIAAAEQHTAAKKSVTTTPSRASKNRWPPICNPTVRALTFTNATPSIITATRSNPCWNWPSPRTAMASTSTIMKPLAVLPCPSPLPFWPPTAAVKKPMPSGASPAFSSIANGRRRGKPSSRPDPISIRGMAGGFLSWHRFSRPNTKPSLGH